MTITILGVFKKKTKKNRYVDNYKGESVDRMETPDRKDCSTLSVAITMIAPHQIWKPQLFSVNVAIVAITCTAAMSVTHKKTDLSQK